MPESTTIESIYQFCKPMVAMCGLDDLREPNEAESTCIMAPNAARGFPRILESINCMHWSWKKCPFAWNCLYTGYHGYCSVVPEVVDNHELWIWYSFFGMAGSQKGINMI
jgi:hypothetical protein